LKIKLWRRNIPVACRDFGQPGICRIAYYETDDAMCAVMAMSDYGLKISTRFAVDVAVFLHGGPLWMPCLWLDARQESGNVRACWHISEAAGRIAVPKYFRQESNLTQYCQLDEVAISERLEQIGRYKDLGFYRDAKSRAVVFGPSPLCRH
jgi:hypothetical protein